MAINLYSKASVDSLLSPKLSISSLTNAAATTLNATAPTTNQVLSYDGTELKWATVAGGGGAAWGGITGTLSSQTDLQNALGLKAPLASPTFTGTVTIPVGASISGYLTTSTASSTYLAKASNLSDLANTGTARTNLGLGGLAVLNDAPSDGSQYARQSGAWAVVTGGGGGSGGVNIQTFSTAGTHTWTKPAGAKYVIGYMWGSGGGGGSGARNATTGVRSGGGGGAGGGLLKFSMLASDLSATETVVIGAGGVGGPAKTTDNTAGSAGSFGGETRFGIKVSVFPASSGSGGSLTSTGSGGTGSQSIIEGIVSITSVNAGGLGSNNQGTIAGLPSQSYFNATGGAGGAGAQANGVINRNGAQGGAKQTPGGGGNGGLYNSVAGGSGGIASSGAVPTAGTDGSFLIGGGTGGGSGAYRNATAGMAGANGGAWGGGGGGGSGSDNGFASGAGGNGGAGALVLITFLG